MTPEILVSIGLAALVYPSSDQCRLQSERRKTARMTSEKEITHAILL